MKKGNESKNRNQNDRNKEENRNDCLYRMLMVVMNEHSGDIGDQLRTRTGQFIG